MSRVLLLVPHEDDELLVGGPMLVNLCRHGYEVYVYIATNGDYTASDSAIRANESLKALKLMGVDRSRVFFGGYGDSWQGAGIYDSDYYEEKISVAGYRKTHGPAEDIDEWHFIREKEHAPYTKNAYLEDIYELVERLRPEAIISVGFDLHSDHRALYLMTLEALARIYEKDSSYSPAFLEKFAYEGNLFGERDFYQFPHLPSKPFPHQFEPVFDDWSRRICYQVPKDCNSFFLVNNLLFWVCCCYRSQKFWLKAERIINSDIVYWQRNTANRLTGAEITATSGEVRWLNDNKVFEPVRTDKPVCDFVKLCFRPKTSDGEKIIKVRLKKPSYLRMICLYFNTPGGISTDVRLRVLFTDGSEQIIRKKYKSEKNFSIMEIRLDGRSCPEFSLNFENVQGDLGLGEIEALEEEPRPPFEEFLAKPQNFRKSYFLTGVLQIERLLFAVVKWIYRIMPHGDKR